jgi:uroporphyrinogen decarboxylase
MQNTRLLQALQGKNQGRPPVWFMRQAGRYLPEYQALRKKHSLKQLFCSADLAITVTKMPLQRFDLDAAILFSDITIIALAFGLDLEFQEGPKIGFDPLSRLEFSIEKLKFIEEAIQRLKQDLHVPLLGFCGAPFTVASYFIGSMEKTLEWMRRDPKGFSQLIDTLTEASIQYLQMQERAGVNAVQIFDSWASVLTREEHERYSQAPLQKMVASLHVPALFFMRNMGPYIEKIPCAVSLDWTVDLKEVRKKTAVALQGNLDPKLLFESPSVVKQKASEILKSMKNDPAFIFNLGHGVLPQTPIASIEALIESIGF